MPTQHCDRCGGVRTSDLPAGGGRGRVGRTGATSDTTESAATDGTAPSTGVGR